MRSVDDAIDFLEHERTSGSTEWGGYCEKLCRMAYGLDAMYSSAEVHANAIPSDWKEGHDVPRRGQLVLYKNGRYGHIVIAYNDSGGVYTNDYGGYGTVCKTDHRNLISWCGATSWFTSDPWWSNEHSMRIDTGSGGSGGGDEEVAIRSAAKITKDQSVRVDGNWDTIAWDDPDGYSIYPKGPYVATLAVTAKVTVSGEADTLIPVSVDLNLPEIETDSSGDSVIAEASHRHSHQALLEPGTHEVKVVACQDGHCQSDHRLRARVAVTGAKSAVLTRAQLSEVHWSA